MWNDPYKRVMCTDISKRLVTHRNFLKTSKNLNSRSFNHHPKNMLELPTWKSMKSQHSKDGSSVWRVHFRETNFQDLLFALNLRRKLKIFVWPYENPQAVGLGRGQSLTVKTFSKSVKSQNSRERTLIRTNEAIFMHQM